MRWPVRYQVLWPMVLVMLGTLIGVTASNAYFAVKQAQGQIERQLTDVVATLREARFPLTDAVLRQMHGLSGAEFVLTEGPGRVVASSLARQTAWPDTWPQAADDGAQRAWLGQPLRLGLGQYYHAAVRQPPPAGASDHTRSLHILYPVTTYDQVWRQAVVPPLAVGTVAMVLVGLVGIAVAGRVTRPLSRLLQQVDQIAQGDFQQLPIAPRNDEIADLSRAINRMSAMLASYEQDVRKHERLRTLSQLASGMAHQLRNAATGGRLAVELHRRSCSLSDDESLMVAQRQFIVMERHLQQLLSLGNYHPSTHKSIDLQQVVAGAVGLARPVAQHMLVDLQVHTPAVPMKIIGDPEGLEQMLVNLLDNAISAAAESPNQKRSVWIQVTPHTSDVTLRVADNGPGPPMQIQGEIFDPFVTGKEQGTGLGLAFAQEIANSHGGVIRWVRDQQQTCFIIQLPRRNAEGAKFDQNASAGVAHESLKQ